MLAGSCHCGALRLALETALAPERAPVRACACGFCRRHGARTLTDPEGRLTVTAEPGTLRRYRFGLGTADFLLCARCGVYAAAVIRTPEGLRATLNVNLLDAQAEFDPVPPAVDYAGEDRERRIARRRARWTPAAIREIESGEPGPED